MADPKITDSRDDHKTFQSIRRNEINIDYYNLCEEDESNFVYQRNLFKALPFLKPESCKSCPNSRFDFRKEKLIDPESFFLAKSLSNYPESVKKEDRARFERLKSFYLLHEIPDFKMQNMNEFESDLKTSIERCHPSVARIIGYTFKHPKNKDKSFLLLTERPVNGSLYSYFNFLSRYNQSNAKFSKSCSKSTISEPYSNENIKLSNEQKYLMILGIISGIEFIHKLGFVHSKLNPSSIFLDEQLRSVICNYEFKHESKETEENDIISILNKSPAFVSPETYQSQIVTQKSDVFCFGMIVYYILTETLPYGKLKKDKIAKALIDRELPVLPNDFDECWSSLIERCCDSNPDDRPDSNELLLELLDKDAMYKYVKSMSPGYKPKFTDAQIDYVNRLLDIYTLNQNNEDLIDFDIYDLIDKSEIHHEDVETFTKCNQSNVECLKKVAYYFLRGENNYPKDDELALAVFQRAADLNDPESTKMIAKLYQENWSNIGDLNTSLAYYNIALKLYKGNEAECKEINHEIKQIKKKIDNPSKYFGKFGKDEDAKRPKEVTFEDTTIFFQEVSNRATKDSIINFFKSYNNVKVKMKPNAFSQSAKVTFESLKDKTKVLNEIRRHPNNFMLYNERMVLQPTNRALQRQRARRRIQGTLLGAPIIAKRQIFRHTKNLQLNLNDFYPGPGKIKKKKDDDDDDDDNDVINTEYERIGSGSFGIAYKIYEKKTNKIYVAKVFKYSFKDIKEKKNFRREIAAQTEIRHPLVIRIYGYAMHSLTSPNLKVPTLIMEYAPNKTLADVIREDPDWWDKTTKIMAIIGISRGMSFIHNQNYIHRDLKPDNIFFDENHEVKIGDFGCSRKCSSNDAMSNAIGTPLYMAPELFDECHVYYSYEVDVYPFGFILLEILTGKLTESPTRDKYRFYSKFVLKNWRPEIPEELDENLKKIIRLSWSKFVNDRPLYQEIFTIFRSLFDGPLNKDSYIKGILDGVDIARVKDYLKRLDSYEY